jgi:hypothetical protein
MDYLEGLVLQNLQLKKELQKEEKRFKIIVDIR